MSNKAFAGICPALPCVDSADIIDSEVTTPDIANKAVTSAKIADGSVLTADVGFNYAGSSIKGGAASDLSCVG